MQAILTGEEYKELKEASDNYYSLERELQDLAKVTYDEYSQFTLKIKAIVIDTNKLTKLLLRNSDGIEIFKDLASIEIKLDR